MIFSLCHFGILYLHILYIFVVARVKIAYELHMHWFLNKNKKTLRIFHIPDEKSFCNFWKKPLFPYCCRFLVRTNSKQSKSQRKISEKKTQIRNSIAESFLYVFFLQFITFSKNAALTRFTNENILSRFHIHIQSSNVPYFRSGGSFISAFHLKCKCTAINHVIAFYYNLCGAMVNKRKIQRRSSIDIDFVICLNKYNREHAVLYTNIDTCSLGLKNVLFQYAKLQHKKTYLQVKYGKYTPKSAT